MRHSSNKTICHSCYLSDIECPLILCNSPSRGCLSWFGHLIVRKLLNTIEIERLCAPFPATDRVDAAAFCGLQCPTGASDRFAAAHRLRVLMEMEKAFASFLGSPENSNILTAVVRVCAFTLSISRCKNAGLHFCNLPKCGK